MLRSLLKQDVEAGRIFEQAICEMRTRTPRMPRDGMKELVRHSGDFPPLEALLYVKPLLT